MKRSILSLAVACGISFSSNQAAASFSSGRIGTSMISSMDTGSANICGAQLSESDTTSDYYRATTKTSPQACHRACQKDQKCATFLTWAFSPLKSDGHVCYLFSRFPDTFPTGNGGAAPFLVYDKNCVAPPRVCGLQEASSGGSPNDYYRVMRNTSATACHQACKKDQKCISFMTWAFPTSKSDGPVCYLYARYAETFDVPTEYSNLYLVYDKDCPASA